MQSYKLTNIIIKLKQLKPITTDTITKTQWHSTPLSPLPVVIASSSYQKRVHCHKNAQYSVHSYPPFQRQLLKAWKQAAQIPLISCQIKDEQDHHNSSQSVIHILGNEHNEKEYHHWLNTTNMWRSLHPLHPSYSSSCAHGPASWASDLPN